MASSHGNGAAAGLIPANKIISMVRNNNDSTDGRRVWNVTTSNGGATRLSAEVGAGCDPWTVDAHFRQMGNTTDPLRDLLINTGELESVRWELMGLHGLDWGQKTALEVLGQLVSGARDSIKATAGFPLSRVASQDGVRQAKLRQLRSATRALGEAADRMRAIVRLDDLRRKGILSDEWMGRFLSRIAKAKSMALMWMDAFEQDLFV